MADESGAGRVEPVAEVEEASPEEAEDVEASPKRRRTSMSQLELWGKKSDDWVQGKDVLMSLDDLEIGVGLEKGQVRPLREDIYKERLSDLLKVMPDKPVDVTVWNPSLADPSMPPMQNLCVNSHNLPCTGAKKAVISGQHTVKALLELRRRYIEAEKPLPSWLVQVNAKVLKPETPVHWRQMFAGDEQFRQGRAKQLQLSDLAAHLLGTDEVKLEANEVKRLAMALRKCGFDRAESVVCHPFTEWTLCDGGSSGIVACFHLFFLS